MSSRLGGSVLDAVPLDRHKEHTDGGGSTITSILWHMARHQDIAINVVVRGQEQILDSHRDSIGASDLDPGEGLAEAESRELTVKLDSEAVVRYYQAVCTVTSEWLATITASVLDGIPDATGALTGLGVLDADYPWLHRMWDSKPVSFHVRWEAIGHGVTHTGEMVSMRNRLGLSPF